MAIGISRSDDKEGGSCDEEASKGYEVSGNSTFGTALDVLVLLNKFTFVGTWILWE